MSRKRGRRVEQGHLVERRRNPGKENEVLHSEIYKDPSVREILNKIPDATELESLQLMFQLQKVARGDASIIESPELADLKHKMLEEAAKRDRAAAAFEADREGFIEDLFNKGERIKKTGVQAEKIKAKAANTMATQVQNARINQGLKRKKLEYDIKIAPTEKIFVHGVNTLLGGSRSGQWEVWPEEVRIGHLVWYLDAGEHEVPKPVAEAYRQKIKSREEGAARKKALSKFSEGGVLTSEWNAINKRYSGGESLSQA